MGSKLHDMIGWPCPKYQAIPRISEARLNIWSFQSQEKGVDDQLLELHRHELLLLLLVSLDPVG